MSGTRVFGKCDDCGKQGFLTEVFIVHNVNHRMCEGCYGEWVDSADSDEPAKTPCPQCGGSGLDWESMDCDYCDGHGYLWWE